MGRRGRKRTTGVTARARSIRVRFYYRGERVSESIDLAPTPANLKYARRLAEDIDRALERGTFDYAFFFPHSKHVAKRDPRAATVKDCGEKWFRANGRLAGATLANYRGALNLWYGVFGADTPIASLTATRVEAEVGAYPWSSPKRCNNALTPLWGFTSVAFRDGLTPIDLAAGVESSDLQAPVPDPLTLDEAEIILADIGAHYHEQVYNYFDAAFFTGFRPEEGIALMWPDLDFNLGLLRVQRARGYRGEIKTVKGNKVRDIELSARALAAFQRQKAHTFLKKDGCVFESPVTGKAYYEPRPLRETYWDPALKRTGIRHRTPYHTRHTYATALIMVGCNERWLAKQMGNSPAMIRKHYATWLDRQDNGRQRTLQDAAFGAVVTKADQKHG